MVDYGKEIGELPTSERAGHEFLGWWTDAEDGERISPTTIITSDVTFYAHWRTMKFTATFDANGGTNGTTKTQLYGTSLVPPETSRMGYAFMGWIPEVPSAMPDEDTTYVAQWQVKEYTITFDADGGVGGNTTTQRYGSYLSAPEVSREGYTFVEWDPPVPATVPAENATYVAQWQINRYMVTFDANGGSGGASQNLNYNSPIVEPWVSRSGYTFSRWQPIVPERVPAKDTTYVAQWLEEGEVPPTYHNVEFHVDSEKGTPIGDLIQKVEEGKAAIAPDVQGKVGWTFVGWDKSFDNIIEDTTINAQFTESYRLLLEDGVASLLCQDGSTAIQLESEHE